MNPSTSTYDEKWGTDYEGRIGVGSKHFRPLAEHPSLTVESRERLIAFQAWLPTNVYSVVYEAPPRARRWMDLLKAVLAKHNITNEPPLLTVMVLLGANYNPKAETTDLAITQIIAQAERLLRSKHLPSIELIIIQGDKLRIYLGAVALTDDSIPDLFYRLRE